MFTAVFLPVILLFIGFLVLVYGANWLVDGASSLAKKLSVSEIAIGLTIVAFGTSSPEFVVNVFASFEGHPEIAFGNILGSNLFNILMVLGIAGVISPIAVKKNTVRKEIPFLLIGTIFVFALANNFFLKGSVLCFWDGLFLVFGLVAFQIYVLNMAKEQYLEVDIHLHSIPQSLLLIALGIAGLILGGELVVKNAIKIARLLNMSENFIGLSLVALGTSLPELVTSVVAVVKKHADIAVGNVIGSNIFNLFMVLGISSMIRPLNYDPALNPDFAFLIVVTLLLYITMFTGKKHKLDRWEAAIFLFLYGGYIYFLIYRG
ncbi:MAG: calcium/sodium antiporter [Candidatus Cloacimonadota bacterium]|nr:calcium/sodium antiporter [Candidatus Cloacimonadota bacterium]